MLEDNYKFKNKHERLSKNCKKPLNSERVEDQNGQKRSLPMIGDKFRQSSWFPKIDLNWSSVFHFSKIFHFSKNWFSVFPKNDMLPSTSISKYASAEITKLHSLLGKVASISFLKWLGLEVCAIFLNPALLLYC